MEETILSTTHKLFTMQGIHQFTMDELSHQLGVSKKTLYRFFPSRQDLVEQVCNRVRDIWMSEIDELATHSDSSLDMLLSYIRAIVRSCKKWSPVFFSDLRKHYPVQWVELTDSINKSIYRYVRQNLERGISEGTYRGNIHPELLINIWQQHIQTDFEFANQLMNDYSKDEVFRQAMYLFLYGIISAAAIPELEEKLADFQLYPVSAAV